MPGLSDDLDLPLDPTGLGSRPARRPDEVGFKVKAVAILMVMAIVGLSYLRFGPLMGHEEKAPPEKERTVPIYMDVRGDKTLSGKNLTIKGDIIVRDGASLTIENCNIAMNGTLRVNGSLAVRGSSLSDMPPPLGFSGYNAITVYSNLTGCNRAWLNTTVEYDQQLAHVLYATVSAEGLGSAELWGAGSKGSENVSLDLSAFCGAVVRVGFDPGGPPHGFAILDPVITTDRFTTPTVDMMVKDEDSRYEIFTAPGRVWRPMRILCDGGTIDMANSTVLSGGGYSTQLEANNTDIRVAGVRFAGSGSPYSSGTSAIKCANSRLDVRASAFNGLNGISARKSAVTVSDSSFNNQSGAIRATDCNLTVERCRFTECYDSVTADDEEPGNNDPVTIRDVDIQSTDSSSSNGILIRNLSVNLENSQIVSNAPFSIAPPAVAAGGNASLSDFMTVSGNFFGVCATHYPSCAGVTIFSGVPIGGMDGLVRQNRWNASTPVARCLLLNVYDGDNEGDYIYSTQYYDKGTAVELDASGQKVREYRFDGGYTDISRPSDIYSLGHRLFGWWSRFSDLLPMEKVGTTPTGYCWTAHDPGRLQFRQVRESGTGTLELDLAQLRLPLDILQVSIPVVPPAFDMGVYGLDVQYDWDMAAPLVSAGLDVAGLEPATVNATFALDGELVDSWESPPWSRPTPLYALNMATLRSAELSITVTAPGRIEMDLSNNRLTVPINVVNASMTVANSSIPPGIWCLGKGVNITFRGCNSTMNATQAFFMGEGDNFIDISGSAINMSKMRFHNCSGRIADTDIFGDIADIESSEYFSAELGSWELDNVTFGCPNGQFERLEREYDADPAGVMERYYDDYYAFFRDWGYPTLHLEMAVENLTMHNISVYASSCNMEAYADMVMTGSRTIKCGPTLTCWGNMSLSGNSFCFTWQVSINGGALVQNNTFSDIHGYVTVGGMGQDSILRGNEFVGHPYSYNWNLTGLKVQDDSVALEGNRFTNLWAAVEFDGPATGPGERLRANSFSELGYLEGYSRKSVRFQLSAQDYEALCLILNRRIVSVQLVWNDSIGAKESVMDDFYFWSYAPYATSSFYEWTVDLQGRETRIDALSVTIVMMAPSGASSSTAATYNLPAGDSLTVDVR